MNDFSIYAILYGDVRDMTWVGIEKWQEVAEVPGDITVHTTHDGAERSFNLLFHRLVLEKEAQSSRRMGTRERANEKAARRRINKKFFRPITKSISKGEGQ